jgi:hypothetical protein
MTTMQRIDEQLTALMDQRRKLQDELRAVQTLINEEFDRVTSTPRQDAPSRILPQMSHSVRDDETQVELTEAA